MRGHEDDRKERLMFEGVQRRTLVKVLFDKHSVMTETHISFYVQVVTDKTPMS